MSKDSAQLFFAYCAFACNAATVVLLVALAFGRRVRFLAAIRESIEPIVLPFAFAVAAVTMLGSLYMSEVNPRYVPCPLCWLQRIVAYPTAFILGIATFRRDRNIRVYVIPMLLIGAAISTYHFLEERGVFEEASFCKASAPCSVPYFIEFHFVTLAYMAFSSFTFVATLLALAPREQ